MNACEVLGQQLDRYLAGQLSDVEATALEQHAAGCERCGPLLETRSRLDQRLTTEVSPDPADRRRVLDRIVARRSARRGRRWVMPLAIAAGLVLAFGLTRPPVKSGQRPTIEGLPAAMAAERADSEFRRLDAARAELRDALAKQPGDPILQQALERLDAQRKSMENLIREFES
jgi:hypothetical protein